MSVKELKFEDHPWNIHIVAGRHKVIFRISSSLPVDGAIFTLDRNQADMLRLYLTEHLK